MIFVVMIVLQLGPYDFRAAVVKYFDNERPCQEMIANLPDELDGFPIVAGECIKRLAI
jgi:hypothetical protein